MELSPKLEKINFLKEKNSVFFGSEYLNFSFAFYRFTTNFAGFILRRDNRRQILELFSDSCWVDVLISITYLECSARIAREEDERELRLIEEEEERERLRKLAKKRKLSQRWQ